VEEEPLVRARQPDLIPPASMKRNWGLHALWVNVLRNLPP